MVSEYNPPTKIMVSFYYYSTIAQVLALFYCPSYSVSEKQTYSDKKLNIKVYIEPYMISVQQL